MKLKEVDMTRCEVCGTNTINALGRRKRASRLTLIVECAILRWREMQHLGWQDYGHGVESEGTFFCCGIALMGGRRSGSRSSIWKVGSPDLIGQDGDKRHPGNRGQEHFAQNSRGEEQSNRIMVEPRRREGRGRSSITIQRLRRDH